MLQVLWFKRDLRLRDHAALAAALRPDGPLFAFYAIEPSWCRQPDSSARHWNFIRPALNELATAFRQRGGELCIYHAEVIDILSIIQRTHPRFVLHAHQETGNDWSYQRDLAVEQWCRQSCIHFLETPQNGVVRRLRDRDGWARNWEKRMAAPTIPAPTSLRTVPPPPGLDPVADLPPAADLGFDTETDLPPDIPTGESGAHELLDSFLAHRGARYQREMSSPLTAYDACSRLSAHFALGTLSIREALQRARHRLLELRETNYRLADGTAYLKGSLASFDARLHWHCHFIQKLESEPEIESHCFIRGFDDLRANGNDPARLEAWKAGRTGYPFIDACMRALRQHGWINFRMRSMLVSFAAYDLWLDWREFRDWLARQFIDYEPGIHYSQLQMQSGTTGINTLRIYNPIKQGRDHDPDATFIHRYVPELRDLDPNTSQEPPILPLSSGYPAAIVDHREAVRSARARIASYRARPEIREAAREVNHRHGSRRPANRS